jgi:hypothetical protein
MGKPIIKTTNMEKFIEYLQEADKKIRAVDHMLYVTYPLVKDKRLLLKILLEAKNSIADCINSILQYEYLYDRITLQKDAKTNFRIFIDQCSKRYSITSQEIKKILDLFEIIEKHKESPFEFIKENRIVILSENMHQKIITIEETKEFLNLAKKVLEKTKNQMRT